MRGGRRRGLVGASVAVALVAGGMASAATGTELTAPTRWSAASAVLPNGRLVTPAGRLFDVGAFPLGVAASPDGRLLVTNDSGQGFGLNTGFNSYCGQGQGAGAGSPCPYDRHDRRVLAQVGSPAEPTFDESLTVLDLRSGRSRAVQAVRTTTDPRRAGAPGTFNFFYVGVAFSPDGRHLYASGGGNDAVYDFPVQHDVVAARPRRTVVLPGLLAGPTVAGQSPNYPIFGQAAAFTTGVAVTPDGRYLLAAQQFTNTLSVIDTRTYAVTQVPLDVDPAPVGGFYPEAVTVSRDGTTAYVAGEGLGEVAVVRLLGGRGVLTGYVSVGDHPTALALSPDGGQLFVANADDDTVSVVDTLTRRVVQSVTVHAVPGEVLGSTPDAVTVSRDGREVYVALAGDDALAVLTGGPGAWRVGGLVPTGWYPSAVAASGRSVYVASAKGYGSRYPSRADRSGAVRGTFEYDGNNMPGLVQQLRVPSGARLRSDTARVRADLLASSEAARSPHNPVPASYGGPSPITHVIEVVRENRTFDQVLGDLGGDEHRPDVNAAAQDSLFGRSVTPNAHAFAGDDSVDPRTGRVVTDPAYATADNFYSDGEASIQGHWWTAAAAVNDYVEKSWPQYYSPRNHVYDPESTVSQPHNCSVFQDALARQVATHGAFTFRNYGELIGLENVSVPGAAKLPIGFRGPAQMPNPCAPVPNAGVDPNAIQDESLDVDNRATAAEFLSDVGLRADGTSTGRPGHFLRSFSYITLSGDHTGGLSFAETPRSRVAENDAGLGAIVSAVSRSRYWASTAIFVMEDDSQDGLDHVDGHRNILFVLSPWSKHTGPDGRPGYVGHEHYDQASVLKTIELITGMRPMSSYDQFARPLYDLFQDKNRPGGLTTADLAPYRLQPLPSFVPERSACYTSRTVPAGCPAAARALSPAVRAALAATSQGLSLTHPDQAGPELEIIAWQLANPGRAVPAALLAELAAWRAAGTATGPGG